MDRITCFLTRKLKRVVNEHKSRVAKTNDWEPRKLPNLVIPAEAGIHLLFQDNRIDPGLRQGGSME